MSDVIVVMHLGRIQQQGDPTELYERPVNKFVAGFIGSSNFIPARLVGGNAAAVTVETVSGLQLHGVLTDPAAAPAAGSELTVAIRPERFQVDAASAGASISREGDWTRFPGRVSQGTYLGDTTEYRIDTDAVGELVIRQQNRAGGAQTRAFGADQPVEVSWQDEATLVLAA